jgi:hypothetical protein
LGLWVRGEDEGERAMEGGGAWVGANGEVGGE